MAVRLIISALLLAVLSLASPVTHAAGCMYYSVVQGEGTTVRRDHCGHPHQTAGASLTPETIETLHFDEDDLGCVVFSSEDAYLVHRDGRTAHVPYTDARCASFEEGLSITRLDGRQAYIDKHLNMVLDPGFEQLGYFEEGYAKVCNGPFAIKQIGEKTRMTGGQCGMIDRSGKLVMDPIYPIEESTAFTDFRNANSHCPAPPIEDENAALCHALRHALATHDAWTGFSIERRDDHWEVVYSFLERNRERTYLVGIGIERADMQWHGNRR